MNKKQKDIISGTFLILFASFMYYQSFFVRSMAKTTLNAAFMPKLVSGLIAILGLIIVFKAIFTQKKDSATPEKNREKVILSFTTLAIFALYVFSIKYFGYFIPTVVYILAQALLMVREKRKQKRLLFAYGFVVTLIIYLTFKYGFKMLIPTGTLFEFF